MSRRWKVTKVETGVVFTCLIGYPTLIVNLLAENKAVLITISYCHLLHSFIFFLFVVGINNKPLHQDRSSFLSSLLLLMVSLKIAVMSFYISFSFKSEFFFCFFLTQLHSTSMKGSFISNGQKTKLALLTDLCDLFQCLQAWTFFLFLIKSLDTGIVT